MSLATIETIQIHEGDRIRWTDNDKERGIYNASLATIAGIENGKVTVELANKDQVTLEKNDPMMQRMDLAYALNMHMAQGIGSQLRRCSTLTPFKETLRHEHCRC